MIPISAVDKPRYGTQAGLNLYLNSRNRLMPSVSLAKPRYFASTVLTNRSKFGREHRESNPSNQGTIIDLQAACVPGRRWARVEKGVKATPAPMTTDSQERMPATTFAGKP